MGQWEEEGKAIVGRIGFQSSATAELWDDEINDFKEMARPLGVTSPFAIDPAAMRVAFQVRGSQIKVKAFTRALQKLLNEASPNDRWRVSHDTRQASLEQWAADVERITDVRLTLKRPNPHYGPRDRVEQIVEGTNAALIEIAARAASDDPSGIDLNDALIAQAIDHAQHSYGRARIVGELNGEKTQWSSEDESVAEIRTALTDPETHEVSLRTLRRELGDSSAEEEEAQEARAAVKEFKASLDDEEDDEFDMASDGG